MKRERKKIAIDRAQECQACGVVCKCALHHIRPFSDGGSCNDDNLTPLCPTCHDLVTNGVAFATGLSMPRDRLIRLLKLQLLTMPCGSSLLNNLIAQGGACATAAREIVSEMDRIEIRTIRQIRQEVKS